MRRSLGFLFLLSLTICLWFGQLFPTWLLATAQSPDASQLVQQGIELYQAGNYKEAIAPWQTALNFYQKTKNPANAAIVRENLARAYEQIGESASAVELWDGEIAYYRQIKDIPQVGRLLTELAQSYSNLGQPRKAIALLCGRYEKFNSQEPGVSRDGEHRSREIPTTNYQLPIHPTLFPSHDCLQDSALQIARVYKDRSIEAAANGSLGNAYRLMGEYKVAIAYLQSSLKIANEINNRIYRTSSLNSLGNAYINLAKVNYRQAQSAAQRGDVGKVDKYKKTAFLYDTQALKYFQDSFNLASSQTDTLAQLRVLLNSITPLHRTQAVDAADRAMQQALALLDKIPDSREKVYAILDLAMLPLPAVEASGFALECAKPEQQPQVQRLNEKAISIARHLQDSRAESFADGQLGHIYECKQDYQQALNLTRQAQWTAEQNLKSKDSLYLWQWQAGRIFKAQSQYSEAIKAYEQAVSTLEEIRSDILTANRDLQLDFRDTVDPIYRELTQLRLEQAALPSIQPARRTEELTSALTTINSLKIAELQNYFGNNCVLSLPKSKRLDLAIKGTETAIFSSIILQERTAILVSLPNGEKRLGWIDLDSKKLRQVINEFRRGLERYRDFDYDPKQAQQLYNWIIRPFAAELDTLQIKTLVFAQDGILRSVPMSALHDGKKFLVQKYAIATTPSLTLTDPQNSNSKHGRVLALGLTKQATVDGRKFPALTNVSTEISQIQAQIPSSKQLLDDNFTQQRLQQELSKTAYPIIHIATHGEFGTEPEDTFLVTGNNDKLTIADLDTAIRSINRDRDAVELLFLTACQTAVGDDRAALGLAGVAVSAGVRSALATLWSIQDAPTVTLVTEFYHHWHKLGTSKAAALQAAQQALIAAGGQYAHPAYWAGFILIGNWL